MEHIKLFGREIPMPQSRPVRIALGVALCLGGLLGFLPVIGFWMLPLGLMVLSIDVPPIARATNRVAEWFQRRKARKDAKATALPPTRPDS